MGCRCILIDQFASVLSSADNSSAPEIAHPSKAHHFKLPLFLEPTPLPHPQPMQVKLTGPADPERLTASGEILFEGGNLNLVATQFALDRCDGLGGGGHR